MTEPEDFLTRWSRRKREAKPEAKLEVKPEAPKHEESVAAETAAQNAPEAPSQSGGGKAGEVLDLSKLPSLDSIGPATDISVFMQPGVPEALSRAALRRAWSADPGIRDFIGLSENSWDFTASDGVHGFGALDPAEAKRLVARLLGGGDAESENRASEMLTRGVRDDEEPSPDGVADTDFSTGGSESPVGEPLPDSTDAMPQDGGSDPDSAALQQEEAALDHDERPTRRGHGRALPR